MALAPLPPWLNVGPVNYLEAAKAGTQGGLGVAGLNQRAQLAQIEAAQQAEAQQFRQEEAARQDALRRWELGQTLAQKAAEQAAEGERAAAQLAETQRYRLDQTALGREQLAEQAGYHDAMGTAALMRAGGVGGTGGARIVTFPEFPGRLFMMNPSGAVTLLPKQGEGDFTPKEMIDYTLRASNAYKRGAQENTPSFLGRSNETWRAMEPVRMQQAAQDAAKSNAVLAARAKAATNAPMTFTNPPTLLTTPANLGPTNQVPTPKAPTNVIVRQYKGTNRRAEFDADTKEFIRWLD